MSVTAGPLVSVVIPTYNHAHFLGRALQSVLDQTYTHWEAIVIDNHSTDNTDEVMRSFTDPRITCLKIHNNGVIAASRNAGIRAAKGEWVAFLDSDDWWAANKLHICFENISDNVDLVYHELKIVRDQPAFFKRRKIKTRQVKKPVLIDLLVNGNAIANSSAMVRKRLLDEIGGINEAAGMVASEDFNTWLRIAQVTDLFVYIPQSLGYYLLHKQAMSQRDMSHAYKSAIVDFTGVLNDEQKKIVESNIAYMSGRYHYLNKKYDSAFVTLRQSLGGARSRVFWRAIFMIILIFSQKMMRLSTLRKITL